MLLATATVVKLFPGFLFLYFVLRRKWQIVIAGMLGSLMIGIAAGVVFGWDSYRQYVTEALVLCHSLIVG
jgi:hypothetical protein